MTIHEKAAAAPPTQRAAECGGKKRKPSIIRQMQEARAQASELRRCLRAMNAYLRFLEDWKLRYAPQSEEEGTHPRYKEAVRMMEPIAYLRDLLAASPPEERAKLVEGLKEDHKIENLEHYLEELNGSGKEV